MCALNSVKTTKYVFQGSSIASLEGKTVFIPFALPDEELKVEVVEDKKNYCRAKIISILKASSMRTLPKCKHFYACGGCNMQMANDDAQHLLRYESAKEVLERAHIELNFPIEFISGRDWQYRNRFQFHIHNGEMNLLGRNTHTFIPIKECPIACKEIQDFLNKLSPFTDTKDGERLNVFAYNGHIWHSKMTEYADIEILGRRLKFSPSAFFQSNVDMLQRLVQILKKHVAKPTHFLDFYSGVGTFSTFFADKASEVHMVEWNRRSLEVAKINIEKVCKTSTETKCFFHAISSEKWSALKASRQFYDVAIVDPPRNGIDKVSLAWFCEKHVERILYVSCDVATFARDSAKLIEDGGYKMEKCYFLDFYPQTHHIEVLGIFNL